jgi:hypothetical protein
MASQALYDQDAATDPRWDLRPARPAPLDPPEPLMTRRAKCWAILLIVAWLAVGVVLIWSGHVRVTDEPQRPADVPAVAARR